MLYGLSFGRVEQQAWLMSLCVSLFADIGVNQPIKVVMSAALFTLIMRKLSDDSIQAEIQECKNINYEERYSKGKRQELTVRYADEIVPSKKYIGRLKEKKLYESRMLSLIFEIIVYVVYIFLCLLIADGHRDPDAYLV